MAKKNIWLLKTKEEKIGIAYNRWSWCAALLPSDSPLCSWLKPAGAGVPLPRWFEVEPVPVPRHPEEMKTRLLRGNEDGMAICLDVRIPMCISVRLMH